MRIMLATIGSRGDVQPLVALATRLRDLGHEVRLCVPPDFQDWLAGLGFAATPIGPVMRKALATRPRPSYTAEQLAPMAKRQIEAQFGKLAAATEGCDLLLSLTPQLAAARSVAESLGIGYVFAVLSPNMLPSPYHAPPPVPLSTEPPAPPDADNWALWERDRKFMNDFLRTALNEHRAGVGLPALEDVRDHAFTDRPWVAADPTVGPWLEPTDLNVFQPGGWFLPDERPLAPGLERFLDSGDPPIYFGFGSSMLVEDDLGEVVVRTARTLGRRAIVSRGWAGLELPADDDEILAVDEINVQALFPRVAAVVHFGSAGTTLMGALGGAPQVLVPQMYDQHYWASRIEQLGAGFVCPPGNPTVDSLLSALDRALRPEVGATARAVAAAVRRDGAEVAAHRLTTAGAFAA
ncbi:glycosyltransferase [Sciscionella sediminilitoris]|uniref:glycosyltransferase n=1 Tax=Sciscionella sediminilitoris TaxID=1445613 RepID=UPI0004DF922F|nr:glycosyltransferase [Sciscionella sp. SE31]